MDFLELAKNRFSERRFDAARPVEDGKLERILEAGRIAPTACNYQPQRFFVIRSESAREKLRQITRYHYNAPVVILVCYDTGKVWRNPSDRRFPDYDSGEQDAAIAACNMMYAAEELGVHTLWIRGFDSQTVSDVFGLPENLVPAMMLALGYPGERSAPARLHFDRIPMEEMTKEL